MSALETAQLTAQFIGDIPSNFMIDPNTYKRGSELGFQGMDFYVGGRGGALGDVDGRVVAASFFFFNPQMIVDAWNSSLNVMDRRSAGNEFARCAHAWAEQHFSDAIDFDRLASLLAQINNNVNPAGAPLFAGWLSLDKPQTPKSRVIHELNALRELRGAYHQAAILATGISPREAVAIKTPYMLGIYGWDSPDSQAEPEDLPTQDWQQAEQITNQLTSKVFEVLAQDEQQELVDLLSAITLL